MLGDLYLLFFKSNLAPQQGEVRVVSKYCLIIFLWISIVSMFCIVNIYPIIHNSWHDDTLI